MSAVEVEMSKGPVASTFALLSYYGFDLEGHAANQLIRRWLKKYPAKWVVAAVVEALYQGRYKVASVDCILFLWYLRGKPLHHFDYEFVDIVCSNVLQGILIHPAMIENSFKRKPTIRVIQRHRSQQRQTQATSEPKAA